MTKKPATDQYKALYAAVREIFYRHDPIGIARDNPYEDEYDLEISHILPLLNKAKSVEELRKFIHGVFVRWFNGEDTAGPESAYEEIAHEVWIVWVKHRSQIVETAKP